MRIADKIFEALDMTEEELLDKEDLNDDMSFKKDAKSKCSCKCEKCKKSEPEDEDEDDDEDEDFEENESLVMPRRKSGYSIKKAVRGGQTVYVQKRKEGMAKRRLTPAQKQHIKKLALKRKGKKITGSEKIKRAKSLKVRKVRIR